MKFKSIAFCLLSLMIILYATGCKDQNKPKPAAPVPISANEHQISKSNSYNSEGSNIVHSTQFYEEADWIYYIDNEKFHQLFKRSIDGKKVQEISNKVCGSFLVKDNWIYFSNSSEDYKPYRMNKSGGELLKINDDHCSNLFISGDFIYYTCDAPKKRSLVRTDLLGNNRLELCDDINGYYIVSKEFIYYVVTIPDKKGIYRLSLDGKEKLKICDAAADSLNIAHGDWIYYSDSSEKYALYRVGMDGLEKKLISKKPIYINEIDKDWIYFIDDNTSNDYTLIKKMKLDGTQETIIAKGPLNTLVYNLDIRNGYIYYEAYDESLWRVKLDGTEQSKLSGDNEFVKNHYFSNNKIYYTCNLYYPNSYKINLETGSEIQIKNFSPKEIIAAGDWLVYSDTKNNQCLSSIEKSSKTPVLRFSEKTRAITSDGENIYFITDSDNGSKLYYMCIKDWKPVLISDEKVKCYATSGDWVYYYSEKSHSLNKIRRDGTEKLQLSNLAAEKIEIDGDWIYFSISSSIINRIKTDGTTEKDYLKGNLQTSNNFVINDGYLYYENKSDLIQIRLKDMTEKTFLSKNIYIINYIGSASGKLYYSVQLLEGVAKYSSTFGINAFDTNKDTTEVVVEGILSDWDIAGNELYFNRVSTVSNWVKMNLDGSEHEVVRILP